MKQEFQIALTADFYTADGQPQYPQFDLSPLDESPGILYAPFHQHSAEISPVQIGNAQGVIVLAPRVTRASLSKSDNLLAIGRFGVGYDSVDVAACTEANVVLLITSGAVDRSVAEATVTWMLALTHQLRTKDRLVREGRWDERGQYMGCELRDRRLGIVGFGGIGREVAQLLSGFGMQVPLVYDPFLDEPTARTLGVKRVALDELFSQADFVSVHCPLNSQTANLIREKELSMMKPTAYLINTARGGIIDEEALYSALASGRIAGAGIDCFADEPITWSHRFGELDNVLLAPHCIAWTDELFRDIGKSVCRGMLDLAHGIRPPGVVNPEVFAQTGFQTKWERLRLKSEITAKTAEVEM